MTLTVHLPEDLERRLVREAERRGVGLETYAVRLLEEHLPSSDRTARASALLRSWVEDGDPREQKETGEYLIRALDEDRPSERPHFPVALKSITVGDEAQWSRVEQDDPAHHAQAGGRSAGSAGALGDLKRSDDKLERPTYLYKYLRFSKDLSDLFAYHRIKFAAPKDFNDPWTA